MIQITLLCVRLRKFALFSSAFVKRKEKRCFCIPKVVVVITAIVVVGVDTLFECLQLTLKIKQQQVY